MDNFMKSGYFNPKTISPKNSGLKQISWRQHSQPQMGSNITEDFSTIREMLARKRSLPRPPVATRHVDPSMKND
ncbi:unnamed protein product [Brugia pahangi]|uniref:Ovule protein n=1 Tax=Brugia pahangi TaxID=6280 RepID=A0A0N4TT49_BRUPA|nr:unnamed protein product [Brugia pahangi]